MLTIGSLFSGFGGLDRAVENVFGARTVWVSDIEPGPCKVLAHRFPDVPNLGDITRIDWMQVEPVDIIAGGSPCQDISSAGRMAGMRDGTRSNLWVEMREAIRVLQPAYVIWENVHAARSTAAASAMESDPRLFGDHPSGQPVLRALGRVLGDLASLGFDAEWHSLRASDIGAPHGRARYFILAAHPERVASLQRAGLREGQQGLDRNSLPLNTVVTLLPTPTAADSKASGAHGYGGNEFCTLTDATSRLPERWGRYAAAITRWEAIHGPAPEPTKPGRNGRPKLNPAFAEWMIGAPFGWITDVPGVTDNEALRMAGNGVVQQQAEAALRLMLTRVEAAA